MTCATIFVVTLISVVAVSMLVCIYYDNDGIRAHVRRKSWCRMNDYELVKVRTGGWGGQYAYMGRDKDGNNHQIPEEICPVNVFRPCPI